MQESRKSSSDMRHASTRHVVVDARAVRPGWTGMGLWALEITLALAREARRSGRWRVTALTLERPSGDDGKGARAIREEWEEIEARWRSGPPLARLACAPDFERHPAADWWLHGGGLQARLRKLQADVFFSPTWLAPAWAPCPVVSTLPDLIAWRRPSTYPAKFRLYLKTMTRLAALRSRALVVLSRATGRDARAILRIPRRRLRLVYPGISEHFRPAPEGQRLALRALAGLPEEPAWLWVGNLEPRKALPLALQAHRIYRSRGGKAPLLVVGQPVPGGGRDEAALRRAIADGGANVLWRERMASAALQSVLASARGLIFTSEYEGFGFPPLEAMACGIPVVAAQTSSVTEVASGAAFLLPRHAESFAEAMLSLESDPTLRASQIEKGLRRARRFTWERAGKALLGLLDEITDTD